MDSARKCAHLKVYGGMVERMDTDPPIERKRWICSLCGEQGIDTLTPVLPEKPNYASLLLKKSRGGFHGK